MDWTLTMVVALNAVLVDVERVEVEDVEVGV